MIDKSLLDWLIQLQHRTDQAYTDKLDGKIPEDLFLRKMNGEKSKPKSSAKSEPIKRPTTITWKRVCAY
jgi:hypothetical protein